MVDLNGATEFAIGISTKYNLHIDWEYKNDKKSENANYELKFDITNNKLHTYHTTAKPINYRIQVYRSKYVDNKLYGFMFDDKAESKKFIANSKEMVKKKFKSWSKRQHKQWKYTLDWYYNFINIQTKEINKNYQSLFKLKEINFKIELNYRKKEISWFIESNKNYILLNKITIIDLINDNEQFFRLWARIKNNNGNNFAKIIIKDFKLEMI